MFGALAEHILRRRRAQCGWRGRQPLKDPTRFRPGLNTVVAVDSVGAGVDELVIFCQGSSARLAAGFKDAPVDAVVIGIVDSVDVLGKQIYSAKT